MKHVGNVVIIQSMSDMQSDRIEMLPDSRNPVGSK